MSRRRVIGVVGATSGTTAVATAIFWLGFPQLIMLVGVLLLFGMWIWADDDRTARFNSSIDTMKARPLPGSRGNGEKAERPVPVEQVVPLTRAPGTASRVSPRRKPPRTHPETRA